VTVRFDSKEYVTLSWFLVSTKCTSDTYTQKKTYGSYLTNCVIKVLFFTLSHLTKYIRKVHSVKKASKISSQEFPRLVWNTKVHYRVCKSSQFTFILRHMNPFHIDVLYLFKIPLNIIFLFKPRFHKWRFRSRSNSNFVQYV